MAITAPACRHLASQRRRAASLFELGRGGGWEVKQGIGLLAALDRPCVTKSFFPFQLFHLSPLTALPKATSPPRTVPSEADAHAGGPGARLFREGRATAYASQFRKKKIMKTTKKLMKGLLADTANLVSAETAPAAAPS